MCNASCTLFLKAEYLARGLNGATQCCSQSTAVCKAIYHKWLYVLAEQIIGLYLKSTDKNPWIKMKWKLKMQLVKPQDFTQSKLH